MEKKLYMVHIPNKNTGFRDKRFDDLTAADQAAKDNNGQLYELDNGQNDLVIDQGKVIGSKLLKDYSHNQN